jgi:hypothetical protein
MTYKDVFSSVFLLENTDTRWQNTLDEYIMKLANLNNWLIYERNRIANRHGVFSCPLPSWFIAIKK